MNITEQQIKTQYEKVKRRGWLPWFSEVAVRANTSTAHILAIGSRETNLENIRGDYRGGKYHGYGVLQVDIGTFPQAPSVWSPQNAQPFIDRGINIYISKINDTKNCVGKKVQVRTKNFVGKAVEPDDLRRIATAAYNCGRWAHYHFSFSQSVDSTTTGKDYSRDVYDRSIEFAKLLEADGETDAFRQEIVLQGKYAREAHKKEADIFYADRVKLPAGESQEGQDELAKVDYEREEILTDPATVTEDPAVIQSERGLAISDNQALDTINSVNSASSPARIPTENASVPSPDNTQPLGDAPDSPPSTFLNVEDYKPFVVRWLKRIWGLFTFGNGTQGFTLMAASFRDSEHWYIYAGIAAVIFIFSLFLVLLGTGGLAWILWHNRKELFAYIKMSKESLIDPSKRNLGLHFEKK